MTFWETTNRESAFGATSRFHAAPWRFGSWFEATPEPGAYLRAGHTDQTKSLLDPTTLQVWDRRLDAGLDTVDAGAYLDLDLRFWKRLRVSGGVRADFLDVSVDDRLGYDVPPAQATPGAIPGTVRATQGLAIGPRVTAAEYDGGVAWLAARGLVRRGVSLPRRDRQRRDDRGHGRRGPERARGGDAVLEGPVGRGGLPRADDGPALHRDRLGRSRRGWPTRSSSRHRPVASWPTEGPSVRRALVGSAVVRPVDAGSSPRWLRRSLRGRSRRWSPGRTHYIPQVPPVVLRVDVTARGKVATLAGRPVTGRVGAG